MMIIVGTIFIASVSNIPSILDFLPSKRSKYGSLLLRIFKVESVTHVATTVICSRISQNILDKDIGV